jgi:hypothetical protein
MAIDPKTYVKKEGGGADDSAAVVDPRGTAVTAHSPQALFTAPIVLERTKKGKKKGKRYTSGTKGLQQLALGVSKAAYRSANSFADGFRVFSKQSNKSARRRRDGLIRDSLRNASSGFAEGLTELGRAPGEIARRISSRNVWRTFRIFTLS